MADYDKICRHCSNCLPDLDCDNVYRCFEKDRCVNGEGTCNKFEPIQNKEEHVTIFRCILNWLSEVFGYGRREERASSR